MESLLEQDTQQAFNPEFQEQLIQEYLLDQGIITPAQLSEAIARLREYKVNQQSEQNAATYIMDQKTYALLKVNPWTGETIDKIQLPSTRKIKPRYYAVDWHPSGSGSTYLFHSQNAREVGEIEWSADQTDLGLTVSDKYVHMYFGELDEHPFLALSHQLHYGFIPMRKLNCLPVDMVLSPNRETLFLCDRGRGTIFIVDLIEFKLTGSLIVRAPGSNKTINIAPTLDGQRLFITDSTSPALLSVNVKSLKIKRIPLSYGILGNLKLSPDGRWLYIQSTRPDESVELVVVDIQNFLLKETLPLQGHLFSTLDDPCDLMAISPKNNYLIFMTYVNNPAMFTPWINLIDLENMQLVERYALFTEDNKPTHLSFSIPKPDGYFKVDMSILDVLMEMEYISFEDVANAEMTIQETLSQHAEPEIKLDDFMFEPDAELDPLFELNEEEEQEIEDIEQKRGNPEVDYPVLHQHQIDPSILIQFKETLLRRYQFVPINQMNGVFRVACVDPNLPEIEMICKKLFPEEPLFLLDFSLEEFQRFMQEFYAIIMTRMKNIVNKMTPEQRADFAESAPEGVVENLENFRAPAIEVPPVEEILNPPDRIESESENTPQPMGLPIPVGMAPPSKPQEVEKVRTVAEAIAEQAEAEASETADTPTDSLPEIDLENIDLSTLPVDKIRSELIHLCIQEFKKIWGIDISGQMEVIETLEPVVNKALKELANFDYTIIRVPDLVNDFSLETVITKEQFLEIVQKLAPAPKEVVPVSKPKSPEVQLKKELTQRIQAAESGQAHRLVFESDDEVIRSDDLPNDHFLMNDIASQRIIEFTNKGMITWQIGGYDGIGKLNLEVPQNPLRLPNGNTLFCDSGRDKVYEVSKSGQIRWQFPPKDKATDIRLHRPVKAMRKLNGNTIIVDQGNHRIIEINVQNKIVWQYGITSSVGITRGRLYSPSDIQCLKGGHFLITDTDNHRVIEVTREEEIVWQYGNSDNQLGSGYGSLNNQLNSPTQAFRLPNGNTLIADSENRRVIEVTPDKEIAWIFDTGIEKASDGAFSFVPVRVIRMGNGNTIVFSPLYTIEVTRMLQPLYLFQFSTMPKAPDYEDQKEESKKIVELSSSPSTDHINSLAKKAAQQYVTTQAKLLDIEVGLVDKQENRAYIVNRYKQIVWRFGETSRKHPHHLERPQCMTLSPIEEGDILITDTDQHRVIRLYRPTKEIVWQYGETGTMGSRPGLLGHPRSAVLTQNDNILITDQYSGRVIEVDEAKNIVWEFGGWDTGMNPLNAPYYAEETPDGNILITDWSNHYVIEVNREGQIVWQYGTLKNPGSGPYQLMYPERAQRLINGNTLIVDTRNHRIIEVDPEGGITWQYGGVDADKTYKKIANPTAAYRLDNGHTLIVHSSNRQLVEVTYHKQVAWQYLLPSKR